MAVVLDALALDAEIETVLFARWRRVLGSGKFADRLQPEALALLRAALLWMASSSDTRASAGEALLGLQRRSWSDVDKASHHGTALSSAILPAAAAAASASGVSKRRVLLLGAVAILLPWAWTRLSQQLASRDADGPRWMRLVRRLEGIAAVGSLLVTMRFLHRGGAPTLPMFIAGMSLAHALPMVPRPPAFDFMEQQLVWRCIADLMLAARNLWQAAPRLPSPANAPDESAATAQPAREMLARFAQRIGLLPSTGTQAGIVTAGPDGDQEGDQEGDEEGDQEDACAFCGAAPAHTPLAAPCGHVCCYYCLATARVASTRARCPRCRTRLM